jgi:hypothetical protein
VKHTALRAAAHNLADSVSGEISFILGYYQIPLWAAVDASPDNQLKIDFLTGAVDPPDVAHDIRPAIGSIAAALPEFFAKHSVDYGKIVRFEVLLRRPNGLEMSGASEMQAREALVTVAQVGGLETTDRYIGWPLKRAARLDDRGRIRRDRKPI